MMNLLKKQEFYCFQTPVVKTKFAYLRTGERLAFMGLREAFFEDAKKTEKLEDQEEIKAIQHSAKIQTMRVPEEEIIQMEEKFAKGPSFEVQMRELKAEDQLEEKIAIMEKDLLAKSERKLSFKEEMAILQAEDKIQEDSRRMEEELLRKSAEPTQKSFWGKCQTFCQKFAESVVSKATDVFQYGVEKIKNLQQAVQNYQQRKMEKKFAKGPSFEVQMRELKAEDQLEEKIAIMEKDLLAKSERKLSFKEEMAILQAEDATIGKNSNFDKSYNIPKRVFDFVSKGWKNISGVARSVFKKALPVTLAASTFLGTFGGTTKNAAAAPIEKEYIGSQTPQTNYDQVLQKTANRNQVRANALNFKNTLFASEADPEDVKQAKAAFLRAFEDTKSAEQRDAINSRAVVLTLQEKMDAVKKLIDQDYAIKIAKRNNPYPQIDISKPTGRNEARTLVISKIAQLSQGEMNDTRKDILHKLRNVERFSTAVETGEYKRANPLVQYQPTAEEATLHMLDVLQSVHNPNTAKFTENVNFQKGINWTQVENLVQEVIKITAENTNFALTLIPNETETAITLSRGAEKTDTINITPKKDADFSKGICNSNNSNITVNGGSYAYSNLGDAVISIVNTW